MLPLLLAAGGAIILVALLAPAVAAALAPPDVASPPGAELLAAEIRDGFDEAMDVSFPAYRVAITDWQARSGSHLVRVAVYDIAFGFTPRTGYAVAGCWKPGSAFDGGWADNATSLAEVDAMWASVPASCP